MMVSVSDKNQRSSSLRPLVHQSGRWESDGCLRLRRVGLLGLNGLLEALEGRNVICELFVSKVCLIYLFFGVFVLGADFLRGGLLCVK